MKTFKEFWPFYLSEHSDLTNRKMHFLGTLFIHFILFFAIVTRIWTALWIIPLCGYGFAWFGHFIIERNRPATFKHPIWSLMGDLKMFYLICWKRSFNL